MQAHLLLQERSKDDLIEEILRLRGENEKLKKALEKEKSEKNALDEHKKFMVLDRLAKRSLHPRTPGQKAETKMRPHYWFCRMCKR